MKNNSPLVNTLNSRLNNGLHDELLALFPAEFCGEAKVDELTCQELVELVTDYFEEALSPADRQRFEFHLGDCTACQRYLAQMQQTIRLVGKLRKAHLPEASKAQLLATFRHWKQVRS